MKRKVSSIALNALLLILGVVTVYPFVWMIFSSFKENQEIMALEQHLLPQKFIIDNYINMNAHFNFVRFFLNSIVITVVITLIVIYTSTICGFVLSKYKFKGRNILFGFVLSTMMIPWCVTIIPKYSMIQAFGWMDLQSTDHPGYVQWLRNLHDEAKHISHFRMRSWRRQELTEPMSFIFSTRSYYRCQKTESSVLRSSSSFGHGRISCGHTW